MLRSRHLVSFRGLSTFKDASYRVDLSDPRRIGQTSLKGRVIGEYNTYRDAFVKPAVLKPTLDRTMLTQKFSVRHAAVADVQEAVRPVFEHDLLALEHHALLSLKDVKWITNQLTLEKLLQCCLSHVVLSSFADFQLIAHKLEGRLFVAQHHDHGHDREVRSKSTQAFANGLLCYGDCGDARVLRHVDDMQLRHVQRTSLDGIGMLVGCAIDAIDRHQQQYQPVLMDAHSGPVAWDYYLRLWGQMALSDCSALLLGDLDLRQGTVSRVAELSLADVQEKARISDDEAAAAFTRLSDLMCWLDSATPEGEQRRIRFKHQEDAFFSEELVADERKPVLSERTRGRFVAAMSNTSSSSSSSKR